MAKPKKNGVTEFLRSQADLISGRLADFQKDADKLAAELSSRGQAQLREIEKLVSKFEEMPWGERSAELTEKAKGLGEELASRFEEVQGKLVHFVGVATRDQVSELADELKHPSQKIDDLTGGAKKGAKTEAKKAAPKRAR